MLPSIKRLQFLQGNNTCTHDKGQERARHICFGSEHYKERWQLGLGMWAEKSLMKAKQNLWAATETGPESGQLEVGVHKGKSEKGPQDCQDTQKREHRACRGCAWGNLPETSIFHVKEPYVGHRLSSSWWGRRYRFRVAGDIWGSECLTCLSGTRNGYSVLKEQLEKPE